VSPSLEMLVWILVGGALGSSLTLLLAHGGAAPPLACGHRATVGGAYTTDSGRTWRCRACWLRGGVS
jgi:hypothetical protein